MMKNDEKMQLRHDELKLDLKNGIYFNDLQDWYTAKYINQYSTRNILMIFIACFTIILAFIVKGIVVGVSNIQTVSSVIKLTTEEDETVQMNSIDSTYGNNAMNIAQFVVQKFVEEYETSNLDQSHLYQMQDKVERIKNVASNEVSSKFNDIANNLYVKEILHNKQRSIQVLDFEFIKDSDGMLEEILSLVLPQSVPSYARVYFYTYIYDRKTGKTDVKNNTANVQLFLDKIQKGEDGKFKALNFKILKYSSFTEDGMIDVASTVKPKAPNVETAAVTAPILSPTTAPTASVSNKTEDHKPEDHKPEEGLNDSTIDFGKDDLK